MEPQEEQEDTAPTPPPSPVQMPEPDLPQEELEPKEEVVYLSDDEDDELAQDGEQPRRLHKMVPLKLVCRPFLWVGLQRSITSQAVTLLHTTD
jgi:hypothetical protein